MHKLIETVDRLSPEDVRQQAWKDNLDEEPQKTYIGLPDVEYIIEELIKWNNVKDKLPPEDGQDILLQNDRWIDEDYNELGVRIGSYGDDQWISAYWCRNHDEYHTRTTVEDDKQFEDFEAINQIPTKWKPII